MPEAQSFTAIPLVGPAFAAPVASAMLEVWPLITATEPPAAILMVVPSTTCADPPGIKVWPPTLKTPLGPAVIVDPPRLSTGFDAPLPVPAPVPEDGGFVGGGGLFEPLLCVIASAVPELLTMIVWPCVVRSLTLVWVIASKDSVVEAPVSNMLLVATASEHLLGLYGDTSSVMVGKLSR